MCQKSQEVLKAKQGQIQWRQKLVWRVPGQSVNDLNIRKNDVDGLKHMVRKTDPQVCNYRVCVFSYSWVKVVGKQNILTISRYHSWGYLLIIGGKCAFTTRGMAVIPLAKLSSGITIKKNNLAIHAASLDARRKTI